MRDVKWIGRRGRSAHVARGKAGRGHNNGRGRGGAHVPIAVRAIAATTVTWCLWCAPLRTNSLLFLAVSFLSGSFSFLHVLFLSTFV